MCPEEIAIHSCINSFIEARKEKRLNSDDYSRLALVLRKNRSFVNSSHLVIILSHLNTIREAELTKGLTELLQEINNIISSFGVDLEAEDVIYGLRKLRASHPEVRNIMATLTRVISSG